MYNENSQSVVLLYQCIDTLYPAVDKSSINFILR